MECDRCHEDVPARVTIRNAMYSDGVFSTLRSKMDVCFDCRGEMKDDENWTL